MWLSWKEVCICRKKINLKTFLGPKQQKFYKNLMLNRIKWSEEIAGQRHVRKGPQPMEDGDEQQSQGERNECILVNFFLINNV